MSRIFCTKRRLFHPDFQQIPLHPRWGSWNVMLTFDFLPHDCWPQLDFFFAISANFARKTTTTTPIVREKQFALSIRAWTKKKSLWYSPLLFFKGHIWSNGDWLRHEPFNSFLLWKSRGKSLPSCQGLSLLYDSKESTKKPFSSL